MVTTRTNSKLRMEQDVELGPAAERPTLTAGKDQEICYLIDEARAKAKASNESDKKGIIDAAITQVFDLMRARIKHSACTMPSFVDFSAKTISLKAQPHKVLLKELSQSVAETKFQISRTVSPGSIRLLNDTNPDNAPSLRSQTSSFQSSVGTGRSAPTGLGNMKKKYLYGRAATVGWFFQLGIMFCHVNGTPATPEHQVNMAHIMLPQCDFDKENKVKKPISCCSAISLIFLSSSFGWNSAWECRRIRSA
jgi:hypothetical protein